jgi:ADP-L-glycero-D-manno-heptose 6-epimerase
MKAMSGKSGVYNIGTGKARSFQDIVDILQKELKTDFQSIYIPNPYKSQYQFYTEADISKTIEKLGYSPNFTLENGIKSYLDEIIKIGENIN